MSASFSAVLSRLIVVFGTFAVVAVPVVPVPDVDFHVVVIVAVLPSFLGRSKPG
jgi:multidrug efflux pump subunit AcrB